MKKSYLLRIAFLLAVAYSSFLLPAQTLKCNYLYEYTKKESLKLALKDYCLCIEITADTFTCYSENGFLRDSIGMAVIAETDNVYEALEQMKRYPYGIDWFIFGQPASGTFREIAKHAFVYLEGRGEYVQPNWEISTETEEICGYTCQKAVAGYLGRTWTIWFTEEIPVNLGPWLLWGAPGLILKAEDNQGLFRFTCEKIGWTQYSRREQIEAKLEKEKQNSDPWYYEYDLAEMEQLWTKMNRNQAVADDMMGGHTEVYDANGNKVDTSSLPYIPLIPDEYWR